MVVIDNYDSFTYNLCQVLPTSTGGESWIAAGASSCIVSVLQLPLLRAPAVCWLSTHT